MFDQTLILPGKAKEPKHFIDSKYDTVFVIGDRPSREIQAGNKAKAITILVQDPKVSKRAGERPKNKLEKPDHHRVKLVGKGGVFELLAELMS